MGEGDHPKQMMDSEDLGIELDKMDAAQRGKAVDIDQAKVEKDVEALVALAKSGQKQEAIDGLLAIEKQGRLAEDITSTRLACRSILQVINVAFAKTVDLSDVQPPALFSDRFYFETYICRFYSMLATLKASKRQLSCFPSAGASSSRLFRTWFVSAWASLIRPPTKPQRLNSSRHFRR